MEMNPLGRKKWAIRALRSTFKEGLHEKEKDSNKFKHSLPNLLLLGSQNARHSKNGYILRKLRESDILKAIGILLTPPTLIFGLWILFAKLLGIPNEILRALLIWLFIFSLFCSGAFLKLYYDYKEKRRLKK